MPRFVLFRGKRGVLIDEEETAKVYAAPCAPNLEINVIVEDFRLVPRYDKRQSGNRSNHRHNNTPGVRDRS